MPLTVTVRDENNVRMLQIPSRTRQDPVYVGRAEGVDIQIQSINVSAGHCMLYIDEGQWLVEDGGSTQGTHVNGQPITEPTYLNRGDVIRLGRRGSPELEITRIDD
jgi:pSer/pThr/pTyr-binding forkhead associated (FHA) protein